MLVTSVVVVSMVVGSHLMMVGLIVVMVALHLRCGHLVVIHLGDVDASVLVNSNVGSLRVDVMVSHDSEV
jgi:hypothetical protein